MSDKPYNLQVPIDKELELALKELAKEDDRTLRAYCKRVLQEHVKNLGKEMPITIKGVKQEQSQQIENTNVADTQEPTVPKKKKKVGALTKNNI